MANEIQRPKRAQMNVEGKDFTYTKSQRKRPTEAVWVRYCLSRRNPRQVEFLKTQRGVKCFVKKNNPENILRTTEPWDPEPLDPAGGELGNIIEDTPTYATPGATVDDLAGE